MSNNRCLVLGGNGFIGKNLTNRLLASGYEVVSFDLMPPTDPVAGAEYIAGDFFNDDTLKALLDKADAIFHLISTVAPASSMEKPLAGYQRDVVQTVKMLEWIKNTNKKIIFSSSGGTVYGQCPEATIRENHPTSPINHYGIVKLTIESNLQMYNKVYGMNNLVLRISNPYGPGQDFLKGVGVIDAVVKRTLLKEPFQIFGNGEVVRDFIHIDDLTAFMVKAISYEGPHTIMNISSGKGASIREIIEIVQKLAGEGQMTIVRQPARNIDVQRIVLDNSLAVEQLGYKPQIDLADGIAGYWQMLQTTLA